MKPKERRATGTQELFRSRLDQIINMRHALVLLGQHIDWGHLASVFGAAYTDKPGHPPLPTRLMAGLAILKHMHNLSDEGLCDLWVENPYFQQFCGEEFFQHKLPFDRSSITRWRQRMGEDKLTVLLQESLAVAVKTKAAKPSDFAKVAIDTTVQPKKVMFPTDAKLTHRAMTILVRMAKKHGVDLRQSYARIGKHMLIAHQRYAHAKQHKRARKCLKKLRTYLGRIIRDIGRKVKGNEALQAKFDYILHRADIVRTQRPREAVPKVYSLHAPEVECIGKGKAHKPYEFGVKASIAATLNPCAGGHFIAHACSLPGRPYDGHTLEKVIPAMEKIVGNTMQRAVCDRGYRGHKHPPGYKFKIFIQGQKQRVTPAIKKELKRRSSIEPVIGHCKSDHRMDRNFLSGHNGDAINVVLAAVGYNFRRLLVWLRRLSRAFIQIIYGNDNSAKLMMVA
jgi:transposase, IS5 family